MLFRFFFAAILALTAPLAFCAAADAPASRYAFALPPAERFEVGATLVERYGSGTRPLILIPGLAGGAWVWQEAVRRFMPEHTVYVLTFPGFDGRPAVPGATLAAARQSLVDLIETRKLAKPALIGHSMGGTMALAVAAEHPDLVGAVVTVDGLPVFPGTEEMPAQQRAHMIDGLRARMGHISQAVFADQQQEYMRAIGVVDMGRADELAKLNAKSDPGAVAAYMAEAFALDLRTELPKITAPVLVIAPYLDADAQTQQMTEPAKTAYYRSIMQGTPHVTVVPVAPARHYAMFDAPDQVFAIIGEFLKLH